MKLVLAYGEFITDTVYVVIKEEELVYIAADFRKNVLNPANHRKLLKANKDNKFYQVIEIKNPPRYDFLATFDPKKDWVKQWGEHRYRESLVNLCFNENKENLELYKGYCNLLNIK